MKVLLLNTDDFTGGAAIACRRLLRALNISGLFEAKMLVQTAKSAEEGIIQLSNSWFSKKVAWCRFVLERLFFLFFEKSKEVRFLFNPGRFGINIADNPFIKSTDIIHLHWINFGFLSIDSIGELIKSGKPIVWTLHDMWAFTGGCHHSGNCENYQNQCGNCNQFLKNPSQNDLSNQIWEQKIKVFEKANLTVVTCSDWLNGRAQKSSLFAQNQIVTIPNPINTALFKPIEKSLAQNKLQLNTSKKYILFAAMNIHAEGKGYQYFSEAIQILFDQYHDLLQNTELLIFGKANVSDFSNLPLKVNFLGQLSAIDLIINAYNASSVFVIPSLEENLPNTIMEAMACGTPVVGFEVGGIPEMIVHKETGYLAQYKSAKDLANGIFHVLFEANYENLSKNSREKVVKNYSEEVVSRKYEKLYNAVLEGGIRK